jgi:hypothetical protein
MSMEDIPPLRLAFEKYRHHYDNGGANYSVTELIQPVRITLLQKRHFTEILKKPLRVSEFIDSFDGTAMHALFEKLLKDEPRFLVEKRVFTQVETEWGTRKVSGCPDLIDLHTSTLWDYKKTSVWKKIFGDVKKWEEQLNIYCHLIRLCHEIDITKIDVVGWWKDWSEKDKTYRNDPKYPDEKIERVHIPLWTPGKQQKFLYDTTRVLALHEGIPDEELPFCSPDDMWERGGGYAVMPFTIKPRRKRGLKAARVLPTREAAEEWMNENGPPPDNIDWVLEERKGQRLRCENYCDVKDWCSQYKEWKHGKKT